MNIVFAIKSLNVGGGGAERVLVHIANGLVANGHEVAVMTFDGPGEGFYSLDERIRRIDLDVGPPGQPTPRIALLRALPRMRGVVLARRPDVVVGFMHSMYVPLGVALAGSGVPVVASEHTGSAHFRDRTLQRFAVRALSRLFVAKSVPSEVIRRECAEVDSRPVVVLPNPLELEEFAVGAVTSPATPPILLSVGRFMEEKNQLELIAAFAAVASDFPDWTLRLAGDGEMRPQVEREVAVHELRDRVQLPGTVRDMAGEYARAALVAMPSRWESFGLATAEALASSRPVVGFADCPGTNELITHGRNGFLVEGGTDRVRHLEAGLRTLMADAALRTRLGGMGPESVRRYSLPVVTQRWERFIADCAARRVVADPDGTEPC